jgi:uncharacterized protein (DUF2461 family)
MSTSSPVLVLSVRLPALSTFATAATAQPLQHLEDLLGVIVIFPIPCSPCLGVGCGLWHPEAEPLATLREDIDENAHRWKEILRAPAMRREFLNGVSDDEDAVVKAFTHHNRESALKTKPKVCRCPSFFIISHTRLRIRSIPVFNTGSTCICFDGTSNS